MYYNPATGEITAPPNGEQIRVFDLNEVEGLAFREQDPVILNSTTEGLIGSLIQGTVEVDPGSGPGPEDDSIDPSHGHLGYELTIPDSTDPPARGAYLFHVTLSALDVSGGADGSAVAYEDSDPIYFLFGQDLPGSVFGNAIAAVEELPEPSTLVVVTAVSGGIVILRHRQSRA